MNSSVELNFNKIEKKSGGLYIHVPYCASRCGYCAFFSGGRMLADWDAYRKEITQELRERITEVPELIRTIYFGGGTPSLIPGKEFLLLNNDIRYILEKSGRLINLEEFTIEANPDDISPELIHAWKEGGVNRVSLGVQSFLDKELKVLERHHNPEHVQIAIELLRQHFSNISIDLIFGIPGQTIKDWEFSLGQTLASGVTHLSAYSLSFEERTLMTHRRNRGEINEIEEIDTAAMYELLLKMTADAGFIHYEVSNFSLPGFESLHNTSYWSGEPYLGLGPSAASYDGMRRRYVNASQLKGWLGKGKAEELNDDELRTEYIMTRLRKKDGIDLREYTKLFGQKNRDRLIKAASPFVVDGNMQVTGSYLKVVEGGWLIHDYICVELI